MAVEPSGHLGPGKHGQKSVVNSQPRRDQDLFQDRVQETNPAQSAGPILWVSRFISTKQSHLVS